MHILNKIRNTFGKIMVGLVHLTNNESPMEIKLSDIMSVSYQPSLTILVAPPNSSSNVPPTTSLNAIVQSVQSSLVNLVGSSSSSSTSVAAGTTPSSFDSKIVYLVNQSDSIIQTLLSMLSKKDLINEHSSKYLTQYFQFFNFYLSLGIQQVFVLSIHCLFLFIHLYFKIKCIFDFSATT